MRTYSINIDLDYDDIGRLIEEFSKEDLAKLKEFLGISLPTLADQDKYDFFMNNFNDISLDDLESVARSK